MADTKISALPASTTPLAGTEVLPIVQSSATKQVSVANLTAGRSFDALGMTLTSTDAGAAAAPLLELYRDSATPAASDTIGEIEFNGEDSAGNKQAYGLIHASILSPTSTAEQGQIHIETATAGVLTEKMIIGTTNLVINEIGAVFNVRIEGDTDANLFYTDATNSRVGVGTASPAAKLDVVGTVGISSTTTLSGLTASTALALNASKEVVSVTNTGTGNNVLATGAVLDGGLTLSTGNLAVSAGKTFSLSGNVSAASGVAATLFTVGSGEIYLVSVVQDNGDGNVFWTGTTTGRFNTSITNITPIASAFLTASASGTSFQITQSTGTTRTFNWFALRLCGI